MSTPTQHYDRLADLHTELRRRFERIAGNGATFAAMAPAGQHTPAVLLIGGSRNRSGRNVPADTVRGIQAVYIGILRTQRALEESMRGGV